jgi:hypothetical protein
MVVELVDHHDVPRTDPVLMLPTAEIERTALAPIFFMAYTLAR